MNHVRLLSDEACDSIKPVDNFDFEEYKSQPWFSVRQRETLPEQSIDLGCVEARYSLEPQRSWHKWLMGWDFSVNNYGSFPDGTVAEVYLCAKIVNPENPSAVIVGPCFLPSLFFRFGNFRNGNYWVVVYNETAGYAAVTGGQPSIDVGNGTCINEEGKGFWFLFRERDPSDELMDMLTTEVEALGINTETLTDMYDVDHSNCTRPRPDDE